MAEEKSEGVKKGMSPWEQHSAVINLPRFDYNAPSSLLRNSHSGFLITCTIKREKSATKEAISILHKFVEPAHCDSSNNPNESSISKRQKLCTDDAGEECLDSKETESATANSGDGKVSSAVRAEPDKDGVTGLSLVKLTRNGLLLFTYPNHTQPDTVNVVSNIIQALESGNGSLPAHQNKGVHKRCQKVGENLRDG
ncbi:unnamed protein product [Sphenostylis stenocarpa]|uniref:Uncharacterized protein n=1 Tax=Sphenostylis stenocarpa TaxID=92480 RepID=A0AA87BC76_9FABA|nr:unnamed protein product [Sphenostylis stenocarpa]